jgi:hypothetical protein
MVISRIESDGSSSLIFDYPLMQGLINAAGRLQEKAKLAF